MKKEPITPTAPLEDAISRKRSLSLPLEPDHVHPETLAQVHSSPRPLRPVSKHDPLSDDEEIAPQDSIVAQKETEPLQMILHQIVKDTETADRYAKYVNRKK